SGLITTVKAFPTEGRYVPKLMRQMEEAAPSVKGGPAQVAQVYVDLLPGMIVYYKSDTVGYYKTMREQARAFFQQHNLSQMESALELRIAQAKAVAKIK